jgi:membrane protein
VLLSFGLAMSLGFLLLVSLVASAVLTALQHAVASSLPMLPEVWPALDIAVSFTLLTLLFSAVYKFLPDAEVAWSDVAVGAAATAMLYYSAVVCFLGAEFTQVYAHRYGSHIRPSPYAVRRGEKDEFVEPA